MVHGKWFVPNIREINTLILQEARDCKMAGCGGFAHAERLLCYHGGYRQFRQTSSLCNQENHRSQLSR